MRFKFAGAKIQRSVMAIDQVRIVRRICDADLFLAAGNVEKGVEPGSAIGSLRIRERLFADRFSGE
jgi:hypothetical protein